MREYVTFEMTKWPSRSYVKFTSKNQVTFRNKQGNQRAYDFLPNFYFYTPSSGSSSDINSMNHSIGKGQRKDNLIN